MRSRAAVLVLVLACTACGGAKHAASTMWITRGHDQTLVLRPSDVSAALQLFADGPQAAYELTGAAHRHGRYGGWIARYHRPGTEPQRGVLVLESRVDLFPDGASAAADFTDERSQLGSKLKGVSHHRIAVTGIGEEAVGLAATQPALKPVEFVTVLWQERNAVASVTVQGYRGQVSQATAVALAREQAGRLRRAG